MAEFCRGQVERAQLTERGNSTRRHGGHAAASGVRGAALPLEMRRTRAAAGGRLPASAHASMRTHASIAIEVSFFLVLCLNFLRLRRA